MASAQVFDDFRVLLQTVRTDELAQGRVVFGEHCVHGDFSADELHVVKTECDKGLAEHLSRFGYWPKYKRSTSRTYSYWASLEYPDIVFREDVPMSVSDLPPAFVLHVLLYHRTMRQAITYKAAVRKAANKRARSREQDEEDLETRLEDVRRQRRALLQHDAEQKNAMASGNDQAGDPYYEWC